MSLSTDDIKYLDEKFLSVYGAVNLVVKDVHEVDKLASSAMEKIGDHLQDKSVHAKPLTAIGGMKVLFLVLSIIIAAMTVIGGIALML